MNGRVVELVKEGWKEVAKELAGEQACGRVAERAIERMNERMNGGTIKRLNERKSTQMLRYLTCVSKLS